jgi:hypothetical protein
MVLRSSLKTKSRGFFGNSSLPALICEIPALTTLRRRTQCAFPDGRGIRVALLSKHAVEESEDIVDFPPGPALDIHDLTASGEATPIDRMGRGLVPDHVHLAHGE